MYVNREKTLKDYARDIKHALIEERLQYLWYNLKRSDRSQTFICGGKQYKYAYYSKNSIYLGERAIEVPIVLEAVKACKLARESYASNCRILEVGNVLSYQSNFPHTIIDKYEKADNVINKDVMDLDPTDVYDLVISISTIEHIGFDEAEKDSEKPLKALEKLMQITKSSGRLIITIPLGYNPSLEEHIRSGRLEKCIEANRIFSHSMYLMHRDASNKYDNIWTEMPVDIVKTKTDFEYGTINQFSADWLLILMIE